MRLDGLEQTDAYPYDDFEDPAPVSKDQEALVVHLDWEADPDQALHAAAASPSWTTRAGATSMVGNDPARSRARPKGHDGPDPALFEGQVRGDVPEGEDRPPTWSTAPVFLVPAGVTITQVLVWWEPSGLRVTDRVLTSQSTAAASIGAVSTIETAKPTASSIGETAYDVWKACGPTSHRAEVEQQDREPDHHGEDEDEEQHRRQPGADRPAGRR